MTFVFLFGRPAVGKLTVARTLAQTSGMRLFDNHLIVDAVLALYDFGTPEFIALRERLWRTAFEFIAGSGTEPGVIFTFNPENTVAQEFIDDLFALLEAKGIRVVCAELTAPEPVIESRLANADRAGKGKLLDVSLYRTLRSAGAFDAPVVNRTALVFDTSHLSAETTAQRIADHLAANDATARFR